MNPVAEAYLLSFASHCFNSVCKFVNGPSGSANVLIVKAQASESSTSEIVSESVASIPRVQLISNTSFLQSLDASLTSRKYAATELAS